MQPQVRQLPTQHHLPGGPKDEVHVRLGDGRECLWSFPVGEVPPYDKQEWLDLTDKRLS